MIERCCMPPSIFPEYNVCGFSQQVSTARLLQPAMHFICYAKSHALICLHNQLSIKYSRTMFLIFFFNRYILVVVAVADMPYFLERSETEALFTK